jgi:cobalt-zinc-cadmium efflux system outer membrane protein
MGLMSAVGLLGCVSYEPKPLLPEVSRTAFESRRLEAPEVRRFITTHLGRELGTWPPPLWDVELLTLAAYHFHPSLEVARAQWATAQAAELTAGARPNPIVGANATYNFDAISGVTPWLGLLSATVPIETAGKRGWRLAQARHRSEVARWNLHTAAWLLRTNVRDALTQFRHQSTLTGQLELLQTLRLQQVRLLEDRLRAGAIGQSELAPARLLMEKTRLEWDLAKERQAGSKSRLAEVLGVPLRAVESLPMQLGLYSPELADTQLTILRQQALQGRADLRAALAEYEASQMALRLEVARQYPDVNLGNAFDWDQGQSRWRLFSLSAELPVLNRNEGPIAQARARREEAAARFTALQAKVMTDIDAATVLFRSSRHRSFDTAKLYAALKSQEEAATARVKAGEGDRLDLLAAHVERVGVEALHAEVTYRAELAINQLEDALQQPLDRRAGASAPPPPADVLDPAAATNPLKP